MNTAVVNRPFQRSKVPPWQGAPFVFPQGPLDLEIGCGVGYHSLRYAEKNPLRTLIAIEKTANKYKSFSQRLNTHAHLPNLWPVHGDAISWVNSNLNENSLDRVFLLYPNPNPKNPQARWVNMPFMGFLLSCLKPGGELFLATNIESYAGEAKKEFVERWNLGLIEERRLQNPTLWRTHFEKKYLERGQICFDLSFKKITSIV